MAMRGGGEENTHKEDKVPRANIELGSNDDGEQDSEPTPFSTHSQFVFPSSQSADSRTQCPYCRSPDSSSGDSIAPSSTGATSGYTASDESYYSRYYREPCHFEPRPLWPSRPALYERPSYWSSSNRSRCGQSGAFADSPERHRRDSGELLGEVSPVLIFALGLMCGIALAR